MNMRVKKEPLSSPARHNDKGRLMKCDISLPSKYIKLEERFLWRT